MYLYLKALHIVFIVTWFAGLFYIPRLFIYATEAGIKSEPEQSILRNQFRIMARRLWFGITWPSAIITAILGTSLLLVQPEWLSQSFMVYKLSFVFLLFLYHYSLHIIFTEQQHGKFRFSSLQLRVWNEVATILLVGIVFLIVLKNELSLIWGITGILCLMALILGGIRIYKSFRK